MTWKNEKKKTFSLLYLLKSQGNYFNYFVSANINLFKDSK